MMRPGECYSTSTELVGPFADEFIAEQRKQTAALERIAAAIEVFFMVSMRPLDIEQSREALRQVMKQEATMKDVTR